MKKRVLQLLQNIFWNWKFQRAIIRDAIQSSRKDMIYDIMNRISIENTIAWLTQNKDKGNKYWTLAEFINEKLPRRD